MTTITTKDGRVFHCVDTTKIGVTAWFNGARAKGEVGILRDAGYVAFYYAPKPQKAFAVMPDNERVVPVIISLDGIIITETT